MGLCLHRPFLLHMDRWWESQTQKVPLVPRTRILLRHCCVPRTGTLSFGLSYSSCSGRGGKAPLLLELMIAHDDDEGAAFAVHAWWSVVQWTGTP